MYKACLLLQEASLYHALLEMLGAHLNHQLAEVLHAMSLQCSYWRYDRDDLQAWIQSIKDVNESLKAEANGAKARQLDANELIKEVENDKAKLRNEPPMSNGRMSSESKVEALKARETKAFESGVARGKSEHMNSAENLEALKQARLGGAHAFMQSRSFEAAIVKRATNEGFVSFYKCLSQLKLLKALKEGIDPRSIIFFKDAELRDYPKRGRR
ncbi:hypothetical protein Salat_1151000 [Sesamum alatum]|uniref:Uncharacterized protein n=1 Tax=Sesamum alatum TaxID=300844 RepID=A0AAE1YEB4_9LAMI|nr:hypothetical protein Salat_1151000 [Sesamum alatum]